MVLQHASVRPPRQKRSDLFRRALCEKSLEELTLLLRKIIQVYVSIA